MMASVLGEGEHAVKLECMLRGIPLKEWATCDYGGIVARLASDDGKFITGPYHLGLRRNEPDLTIEAKDDDNTLPSSQPM